MSDRSGVGFYLYPHASRVVMGALQSKAPCLKGGGIRGRIRGFSPASRRRMLNLVASLDRRRLSRSLFVTVTYPADWPADPAVWKRHLDTFEKGLLRRFPRLNGLWRLEAQERGAPHFHFIIFGGKFIPYQVVNDLWRASIGAVGYVRTDIQRCKSPAHALHYVSKYCAKEEGYGFLDPAGLPVEFPGRAWGIFGRRRLPRVPVVGFRVPVHVRDALLDLIAARGSRAVSRYVETMRGSPTLRVNVYDHCPEAYLDLLAGFGALPTVEWWDRLLDADRYLLRLMASMGCEIFDQVDRTWRSINLNRCRPAVPARPSWDQIPVNGF